MTRQRILQVSLISFFVIFVLTVGAALVTRHVYNRALEPVGASQKLSLITVPSGASTQEIAELLKGSGLIRESWAFQWYVRNNGLLSDLKAGTYALNQSQSTPQIAKILAQGEVATDLVTILPGRRLDQIKADLINSGFTPDEVESALNPALYKNHPALVDKPAKANLEGYLYPESFHKTANTSAQDIVSASLDEMQKRLTPSIRASIAKQGLSVHEGVIMASMIEQEVSQKNDKKVVAGVFFNRLRGGMRLESDPTAFYGAVIADAPATLTYDSPYNTYLYDGLPKGPISNVSDTSLAAVAKPAKTQYLYFVAGDDGETYFSRTLSEHEENTARYCTELCQ